jgi:transcriptional regulator with XRE-family HTH domain
MTGITDMDYQQSMADTARGELSSAGCTTITHLARIIGKSRPTAASRWHGVAGYTASELEDIAKFLGITVYDLNDSARMRVERRGRDSLHSEASRITPPQQDAWAQPSRSRSRRVS